MSNKKKSENIYDDQTIVHTKIGDKTWYCPYTNDGIRMLQRMYANCIMAGVGTVEKLTKHIQDNPHLHQTLKNNLILDMRHFGKVSELCEADKKLLEKQLAMRSLKFD